MRFTGVVAWTIVFVIWLYHSLFTLPLVMDTGLFPALGYYKSSHYQYLQVFVWTVLPISLV